MARLLYACLSKLSMFCVILAVTTIVVTQVMRVTHPEQANDEAMRHQATGRADASPADPHR